LSEFKKIKEDNEDTISKLEQKIKDTESDFEKCEKKTIRLEKKVKK